MSLVPSSFPKHIQALDCVLGDFLKNKLSLKTKFFYKADKNNTEFIAKTFDLNIQNLTQSQAISFLQAPMTKKSNLGTKKAVEDALKVVFSSFEIKTKKEDNRLKPFEFLVQTSLSSEGLRDNPVNVLIFLANEVKSLRDELKSVDFVMPQINENIKIQQAVQWRL